MLNSTHIPDIPLSDCSRSREDAPSGSTNATRTLSQESAIVGGIAYANASTDGTDVASAPVVSELCNIDGGYIAPDECSGPLLVNGGTTGSRRSIRLTAARRVLADVWLALVAFRRAVG